MRKRVLASLLALCAAVCLLPATALAEESAVTLPDGVTEESFPENTTVTDGTTYYATLKAALEGIHKSTEKGTLWCKPGADVGTLTHGHVCANLTVYGNGAYISGGERDFELDTYQYRHATANTCGGLTGETTLTVYNLTGAGAWGQRTTANTINIIFVGCKNMQRVYITTTKEPYADGDVNITLKDCTFVDSTSVQTYQKSRSCTVYSNYDGAIIVENCTFTGVSEPININHDLNGTQTITVSNSVFTDCGTGKYNDATWAAPIRVKSSADSEVSLVVDRCSFTYSDGTASCNGDILLGDGRGGKDSYPVYATITNTAAEVQIQQPGDRTDTTNTAVQVSVTASAPAASLSNVAAKIGGAAYTTLQSAIDAASNGDTIQILSDITVAAPIDAKKTLTFQGVTKADGTKPVISSSGSGIFSQSGEGQFTLDNLELAAAKNGQWYIYHSANKLTVNNCDFTMAGDVAYTGNIIMGEGHLNQETFPQYSLTFTNNTVTANSRAAITGIGNHSVITGNVIDLISERHGSDNNSRTSVLALVAKTDGGAVVITGNTFKNANRVLAVDNSTLAAADLTYQNNQFIDTRYVLELSPEKNAACGTYDINNNYYIFDSVVSAPKIENADEGSNHFAFADKDGNSTEYAPAADEESQVKNDVYYTAPTMRPEDLNNYVPLVTVTYETARGEVPASKTIEAGEAIELPVLPNDGYWTFLGWTSDGKNYAGGETVIVEANMTFIARWRDDTPYIPYPPAKPNETAKPVEPEEPATSDTWTNPYADVAVNDWYYDAVAYVAAKGLMTGTTASTFAPNATMTRAMVWTVLARMEGQSVEGGSPWYALAQSWAVSASVSNGTGPNDSITREQLITMLYRQAGSPAVGVSELALLGQFTDGETVSSWAQDAMAWAVAHGILTGDGGALNPQDTATRAQVAAILARYCGTI